MGDEIFGEEEAMNIPAEKEEDAKRVSADTYTKDELKSAKRFKAYCDVIEALFKKDVLYTIEEAENIIEGFMKGRV